MFRQFYLVPILVFFGLSGCMTAYVPHKGEDAAKIRISRVGGEPNFSVYLHPKPVVDGQCGKTISVPGLLFYRPPEIGGALPTRPYVLRTDMVDSADIMRPDIQELKLAPGRYVFSFIGSTGNTACMIAPAIDLEPKRQYAIEIELIGMTCHVRATRLTNVGAGGVTPSWQPYGFVKGQLCTANS